MKKVKIISKYALGITVFLTLAVYPFFTTFSETINEKKFITKECTNTDFCPKEKKEEKVTNNRYNIFSFWEWLNSKAYAARINPNQENKDIIRSEWQKFLGLDIFYPYFKAKKAEKWLEKKGDVTLFNKIKGTAEIDGKSIKYIFETNF